MSVSGWCRWCRSIGARCPPVAGVGGVAPIGARCPSVAGVGVATVGTRVAVSDTVAAAVSRCGACHICGFSGGGANPTA